jgi:hypothetical protein
MCESSKFYCEECAEGYELITLPGYNSGYCEEMQCNSEGCLVCTTSSLFCDECDKGYFLEVIEGEPSGQCYDETYTLCPTIEDCMSCESTQLFCDYC